MLVVNEAPDDRCGRGHGQVATVFGGPVRPSARDLLLSRPRGAESVAQADAERAAALWRLGGPSREDRSRLALAERRGASAVPADRQWESIADVVLVR